MPSKSRRKSKKGKSTLSSKKKSRINRPPAAVQQQVVTPTKKPAPTANIPTLETKKAIFQNPYLASELRNIGILALIMIIILVVLSLVPLPW
jgi:hypothetical protein